MKTIRVSFTVHNRDRDVIHMICSDRSKKYVKIAVVGGGIFGTTTALKLAREGFSVTLFEKKESLMLASSSINQYRVHRGYHYPRSKETVDSCKYAAPFFEKEYAGAIIKDVERFYAISKENSFISGKSYVDILNSHTLPFIECSPKHINTNSVELTVSVKESAFDPNKLKDIVIERLNRSGVTIFKNVDINISALGRFDYVVVATYAALNDTIQPYANLLREYQFEVCEKIVIETPQELKGVSTVIMDGPFMSIDPLGGTGYSVVGHVIHAIHKRSFGYTAVIPSKIKEFLHQGIIKSPTVTNVKNIIESGAHYMPALRNAKHIGSMYTIRTVLPGVESTDARPTIITSHDDRVVTVLSGKVGHSVVAANDVFLLISSRI